MTLESCSCLFLSICHSTGTHDLYDSALKDGFIVSVKSIVVILIGNAGTGKTSFKRILLHPHVEGSTLQLPDEERSSTDLAEAAIRRVSISKAEYLENKSMKHNELKELSPEQIFQLVADAIKERGNKIQSSEELASVQEVQKNTSSQLELSSAAVPPSSPGVPSSQKFHELSPEENSPLNNTGIRDETNPDSQQQNQDGKAPQFLLELIEKSDGSGTLLEAKWVYIIDTGGQPQFLQLLPAFIKNISSCVLFINLKEDLDLKSSAPFYVSGKQLGDPYKYMHTNLQLVENCVRAICSNSEASPEIFILGTHNDEYQESEKKYKECEKRFQEYKICKESYEECKKNVKVYDVIKQSELDYLRSKGKYETSRMEFEGFKNGTFPESVEELEDPCFETIEVKNKRLNEVLNLIPTNRCTPQGNWIHPIDCKNPKVSDIEVVKTFRKCVIEQAHQVPATDLPITWFILEEQIRQYAQDSGKPYISREKCKEIAEELHIKEDSIDDVIDYLLKLNVFRHYQCFPEKIFCDSIVLQKITELVKHAYKPKAFLKKEDGDFRHRGIVSRAYLSDEENFGHLFSEAFTLDDFLEILRELLVIACFHMKPNVLQQPSSTDSSSSRTPIQDFFMPCLLEALGEKELRELCKHSESCMPPLLIYFKNCIPNGLFTSLIVSLMNSRKWKFNQPLSQIYRNFIQFELPKNLPGVVTLIATFKSIEIHVSCDVEESKLKVCKSALKDIEESLQAAWKTLCPSAPPVEFEHAFFCSKCAPKSYSPARVVDRKYLRCSVHGSSHDDGLQDQDLRLKWIGKLRFINNFV